jgi:hypothetical protein
MKRFDIRFFTHARWLACLILLMLCAGCRTAKEPLFTVSGDGWDVRQGQALWRPGNKYPELGGDVVVASHADGRCAVEFSKSPVTLTVAQTTRTNWWIQFPSAQMSFAGQGKPPLRFTWLYLGRALSGEPLPSALHFKRLPDNGWRLENPGTGESLEGFLAP